MRIHIAVNQFYGNAIFISKHFFLHIENGHVINQILIICHCVNFFLLCFFDAIQAMDTIKEYDCQ